jgi:SAM-dependent methyltransferase
MQDWTGGYVTDIEYTSGFYRELAPTNMNFASLLRGFATPSSSEPYTWLELGCGNGLSANALAASNPQSQFYAFDFNPIHIQNAQRLVRDASIKNVSFFEDSFEEAFKRDLPPMDYIVLHGIYTWVNRENRAHIVALIRKLLKPGGVVYVSYNCLPGWGSKAPLRRLMTEIAARKGGLVTERVKAARDFLGTLKEAGTRYFAQNPPAQQMADSIVTQSVNYLAHEYMNADWDLFYHSDVAADMNGAKLTFAASGTLIENSDEASLSPQTAELVRRETDPVMRELLRDFAVNQQFRRDLYIRGARRLMTNELIAQAKRQRICLIRPRSECSLKVTIPVGEANLAPAVYDPILDALVSGPKTVGELAEISKASLAACMNATTLMCSIGYTHLMLEQPSPEAKASCNAFNSAALARAVAGEELQVLAASNLGTAINVGPVDQYFLLAYLKKAPNPAEFVWSIMRALDKRLVESGKTIETDTDNLAKLQERAAEFDRVSLPFYKTVGIVA